MEINIFQFDISVNWTERSWEERKKSKPWEYGEKYRENWIYGHVEENILLL